MLDVHPPNEPIYRWRDFFIHLATITIGLLIALSMEGCVEWQHHRHLVHEAESALQTEIEGNAAKLQLAMDDVKKEQETLSKDVVILRKIIAEPKVPNTESPQINFILPSFSDVSWETAKSTGALGYMPYEQAHEYSDIYDQQNEVYLAERQAARDAILSVAPLVNLGHVAPKITPEDAALIKQRIEVLQGQLIMVASFITDLDEKYKKFLADHRE